MKDQLINILGFAGCTISITTTQLCRWGRKTIQDNSQTNEGDYIPIELYLQDHAMGQIWPASHSFLTPGLVHCYDFGVVKHNTYHIVSMTDIYWMDE